MYTLAVFAVICMGFNNVYLQDSHKGKIFVIDDYCA